MITGANVILRPARDTDLDNTASVALAQKTGYTHEDLMRRAVFARGAYRDLAVYGMVRAEA